jgi:hypothetical protein
MAAETLSVRLSKKARQVLAEAAATHDVAGASALAREILERWAAETLSTREKESLDRASAYIAAHPGGWGDDPTKFFPGTKKR